MQYLIIVYSFSKKEDIITIKMQTIKDCDIIDRSLKRMKYNSLDDMAREEGVIAVLKFLAYNPTMVSGYYRHSNIKVVPFTVKENTTVFEQLY